MAAQQPHAPDSLQRTALASARRLKLVVGRQSWHSHTCLGAQSKASLRSVRR